MTQLNEKEIETLKELAASERLSNLQIVLDNFRPKDFEALQTLIPLAEQIADQAKYRAAQKLVLKTWRTAIIYIGSTIAAIYLLRDQILKVLGIGE